MTGLPRSRAYWAGRAREIKALILAGGRGKRLKDLSAQGNKCMLTLDDKPAIEFSLENACSTDIEEIIIVVGSRAECIINHYGNSFQGKKISYVIQWEQKGVVNAIEYAAEALDGHDFMLYLGDEIVFGGRHQEMYEKFVEQDVFALCGVFTPEDRDYIMNTYAIIFNSDRIYRLVEKPHRPVNEFMGTGNCVFKNSILDYIEKTPIHYQRHEKELPDLIQCAIDDGMIVNKFNICKEYANINRKDDVLRARKFLKSAK